MNKPKRAGKLIRRVVLLPEGNAGTRYDLLIWHTDTPSELAYRLLRNNGVRSVLSEETGVRVTSNYPPGSDGHMMIVLTHACYAASNPYPLMAPLGYLLRHAAERYGSG